MQSKDDYYSGDGFGNVDSRNRFENGLHSTQGQLGTNYQDYQNIENLRSVDEILPQYRNIFGSYPCFNIIQSSVIDTVLYSDDSVVVSAPTGSGKTVIFELAIVRFLMSMDQYYHKMPFKIVYVAPMKALCEERLIDWNRKFANHGLVCISVTGDSDNLDFQSLLNHNLIITTPEKWDSLTRRWRDNKKLAEMVKLFMIDEIHLVGEANRGPTLEAVVCRMKTIQDSRSSVSDDTLMPCLQLRFVGVSATVPNVEDLAEWFSNPTAPARSFKFGDSVRPVQLRKVILGYPYNSQTSTPFKFDLMLNYKLQSVMLQYAEGKPTLIFCSTRKSVEMTSKQITQNITINLNPQQKQILISATANIQEAKIREILVMGVSFHHAGLSLEDRKIIENLFRNCNLPILVTTCTLAIGVNLPAHLVIVKTTKYYCDGEYRDYTESMLQQMIGRAGRPQFDTSATAVILTTAYDKKKVESLLDGEQCIESNLHKQITEHLNAEIVLRTITDLGVALQWLTSTFLYIRARKHPKYYGLPVGLTKEQIDRRLLDMCQIEINRLARSGMLVIDHITITLQPTNTGLLMAKYYIAFETMKLFTQVTGKEILQQILGLISKCQEFSEIYLRVNDKKTLNLLNKCRNRETIRFPFNEKIKTVDMKINCIIQAVFGCLQILEQSLITESQKIMRIGERISKCLAEFLETKGDCYSALLSALVLAKCFHTRLWENTPFVSKQLAGIGSVLSTNLVNAGKTTFQDILETNPREIERIIHRKAPMGNTIQEHVAHLPNYKIDLEEVLNKSSKLTVKMVIRLNNAEILKNQSTANVNSVISVLVGDSENNIILYEKQSHSYFIKNPEIVKSFEFALDYKNEINAHIISEDWVGFDCNVRLSPSTLKKTEKTQNTQVVPKKVATNSCRSKKEPSHIQTFLNTYFKNSKPNKLKFKTKKNVKGLPNPKATNTNVPLLQDLANSVNSSGLDKEDKNVSSTSINNQETETLEIGSGVQSNEKDVTSTFIPVETNIEALQTDTYFPKTPTSKYATKRVVEQISADANEENNKKDMLQKLIDSSINEFKNQTDNKTCNILESISNNQTSTQDFRYLPNESSLNSTSLIACDGFSATARRNNSLYKEANVRKQISKLDKQEASSKKKEYRLEKKLNNSVNFESSLGMPSKIDEHGIISANFKFIPSKKYNHNSAAHYQLNMQMKSGEALENEINQTMKKQKFDNESKYEIQELLIPKPDSFTKSNDYYHKTITWRSPLVISPITKYSPNLNFKNGNDNQFLPKYSDSNASGKSEHNLHYREKNDSLETSNSTSDTNVTLKMTSSRPTLRQNKFRETNLPLSDQAFLESVNHKNLEEYTSADELVSTTFLEDFKLVQKSSPQNNNSNNDNNNRPNSTINKLQTNKLKNREKTSIADYYSRLIKNTNATEEKGLGLKESFVLENTKSDEFKNSLNNPNQEDLQNNFKSDFILNQRSVDKSNESGEDIAFDFDMNTAAIPQMFGSSIYNADQGNYFSIQNDEQNIHQQRQFKNIFGSSNQGIYNQDTQSNINAYNSQPYQQNYISNSQFPVRFEQNQPDCNVYFVPPNNEYDEHCECHKCLKKPWRSQVSNYNKPISNNTFEWNSYSQPIPSTSLVGNYCRDPEQTSGAPVMKRNVPMYYTQMPSNNPRQYIPKTTQRNSFSNFDNYLRPDMERARMVDPMQAATLFGKRPSYHNLDDMCNIRPNYNSYQDVGNKYYNPRIPGTSMPLLKHPQRQEKKYVLQRYFNSFQNSGESPNNYEIPDEDFLNISICSDNV